MTERPALQSAGKLRRQGFVGAVVTAGGVALAVAGGIISATDATAAGANLGSDLNLVLSVGADETQRNLAWYTTPDVTAQSVRVAKKSELVEGKLPVGAQQIEARRGTDGATTSSEYNWFAELTNLEASTEYVYQVGSGDSWSDISEFQTRSFTGDFDFLFFGDPQIGSSGDPQADTAGWKSTLDLAEKTYPGSELLFSAGDQVEDAPDEDQYDLFLSPRQLQEIPLVATIGNHDVGSKAYEQHYNIPNNDPDAGKAETDGSGGDYWFTYKDVLFVDINSNSLDDPSHIEFLKKTIADQSKGTKWQVLAFHHSIYSTARHSEDDDVQQRRADLPETISKLGFDLVLQGHDHSYARSFLLRNGEKADPAEEAGTDILTPGPGGVLYLTANSASGSKYYDQIPGSEANDFKSYLSVGNQEHVPNYTAVSVKDDSIVLSTRRSTAFEGHAANSVVDQMTLYQQNGVAPRIITPGDTTIAQGTKFSPLEGVSANDDKDGDVTKSVEVKGDVDTSATGAYKLTYSVKDSAGNSGSVTRTVRVVPARQGSLAITGSLVAGGNATVRAAGLTPGATYEVTLGSVSLGTITADASGAATLDVSLPGDLKPGDHRVAVTTSDGTQVAWTTFTVGRVEVPSPDTSQTTTTTDNASAEPGLNVEGPDDPDLADTGAGAAQPLLIAGGALVVLGAGLLVAWRRRVL